MRTKGAPIDRKPVPKPAPLPAAPHVRGLGDLDLGFFWSDLPQMPETFGWTSYVHIPVIIFQWGDQSYGFQLMRAAISAGHKRLLVTVDEFGFRPASGRRTYVGQDLARAQLRTFMRAADGLGLLPYFWAIYAADEPNLDGARISAEDMRAYCADIRAVCAEVGLSLPLWCIYGGSNGDRPGSEDVDVLGLDDYGRGLQVLWSYRQWQIKPTQKLVLVPQTVTMDGRGPELPEQWLAEALALPQCLGIAAFNYAGAENRYPGLRDPSNARQRAAWADAGRQVVAAQGKNGVQYVRPADAVSAPPTPQTEWPAGIEPPQPYTDPPRDGGGQNG